MPLEFQSATAVGAAGRQQHFQPPSCMNRRSAYCPVMRTLGITAAAVIGLFTGMLLAGLTLLAVDANESAQAVGTFLGALAGGIGLAVLVARLIPAKPSNLQRGQEILKGREQRIIRFR